MRLLVGLFVVLFASCGPQSCNVVRAIGGAELGSSSMVAMQVFAISPTFSLPWTTSGIDAMVGGEASADSMSLNGTTVTSMLFARESGATGTTWVAENGPTFAATSGTATVDVPMPFVVAGNLDPSSQAVTLPASSAWTSNHDAAYNLGTDDVVWESVSQAGGNSMAAASYGANGWWIQDGTSAGEYAGIRLYDGTTVGSVGASVGSFGVSHIFACLDAGTALRVYHNGELVGTDTTVPAGAFDDATAPLCLGGYGSACTIYASGNEKNAYVQVWHHPAWLSSVSDCDAKAKERFARLSGGMPDVHKGDPAPTVKSRASVAMVDIYDGTQRRMYPVSDDWVPRVVVRQNTDGTARAGLLREPQATNLVRQSADLSTTWTPLNMSISADSMTAPDLSSDADGLVGTTVNTYHGTFETVTVSPSTQYTFSFFAKAGAQPRAILQVQNCLAATSSQYVTLSSCATGTTSGMDSNATEDWGGGWCRVASTFTTTSSATNCKVLLLGASVDGSISYAGDGASVDVYFWGAQLEVSPTDDLPSSYIATTTTTVTRSEDVLRYDGIGNVPTNTHTLVASIGYTSPVNSGVSAWPYSLSVGGASNNMCTMYYTSANQASTWCQTPSGVVKQVTSTALTATGNRRVFQSDWPDQGGLVELLDDGTQVASGTAAALDNPTGIDRIEIGQRESGTSEVPGSTLLSNFKIYSAAP